MESDQLLTTNCFFITKKFKNTILYTYITLKEYRNFIVVLQFKVLCEIKTIYRNL